MLANARKKPSFDKPEIKERRLLLQKKISSSVFAESDLVIARNAVRRSKLLKPKEVPLTEPEPETSDKQPTPSEQSAIPPAKPHRPPPRFTRSPAPACELTPEIVPVEPQDGDSSSIVNEIVQGILTGNLDDVKEYVNLLDAEQCVLLRVALGEDEASVECVSDDEDEEGSDEEEGEEEDDEGDEEDGDIIEDENNVKHVENENEEPE